MNEQYRQELIDYIKQDIDDRISTNTFSLNDLEEKLLSFLEEKDLLTGLTDEEYKETLSYLMDYYKEQLEGLSANSESLKNEAKMKKEEAKELQKASEKLALENMEEADKSVNQRLTSNESNNILLIKKKFLDVQYLTPALQVLEDAWQIYALSNEKLQNENLTDSQLDEIVNKIKTYVEILAGNQRHIECLLNSYSLSILIGSISLNKKSSPVYQIIVNSNLNGLKDLNSYLSTHKELEIVKNIFAKTLVSCFQEDLIDYSSARKTSEGIELLKNFNVNNKLIGAKINQRLMPYNFTLSTEEEDEIQQDLEEFNNSILSSAGGIEEYVKKAQSLLRAYATLEVTKITDTDDMILSEEYEIEDELKAKISDVKSCIMSVYKQVFETPITLGQIKGVVLLDDTHSNEQKKGVEILSIKETTTGKKGEVSTEIQNLRESKTLSWISEDYEYPVKQEVGIKVARHNEVPSLENILLKGYNYFPRFILRYALGFVGKEKYSDYSKFLKALDKDVEQRLYRIYKESCVINGTSVLGEELFYTDKSSKAYRKALIGSFINTILLLTGSKTPDMFNNTQFRSVSVYKHTKDAESYIKAGEYGLLNCASRKFMDVTEAEFENCILDVMVIKDMEVFNSQVTWAYKVLGKVYASGSIPSVTDNSSSNSGVIIGQQLDGNLIKFNLGDNSRFVTSIYAGSRSGKGVTTLSILGAVLASTIGVMYLDFKPDMADCFWQYERANPSLHTYAIDMQPTSIRYGYTAKDSMRKLNKKFAKNNALCSSMLILKNLQVMLLYATYLASVNKPLTHLWILDEINNMMVALNSGREFIDAFIKSNAPKKGEEESEDYKYAKKIQEFWKNILDQISQGVNATFGISSTKFLLIGQEPTKILEDNSPGGAVLSKLGNLATNKYILGRGLSGLYKVGSVSFHKTATKQEKDLLENYRYFIMRDKPRALADETNSDILFKPLLTLNSSNVLDRCWVTGVGKSFGYKDTVKKGSSEYDAMLKTYKTNLNNAYSDYVGPISESALNDSSIGDGVVDEGTGFTGLLRLYYSSLGDKSEQQAAAENAVCLGYRNILNAFISMGLVGENSAFGYEMIEDFVYDFSEEALSFVEYDELKAVLAEKQNSQQSEENICDSEDKIGDLLNNGVMPTDSAVLNSDNIENDLEGLDESVLNRTENQSNSEPSLSSDEIQNILNDYNKQYQVLTNNINTLSLNDGLDIMNSYYDDLTVLLRDILAFSSEVVDLKDNTTNLKIKSQVVKYVNQINKLSTQCNVLLTNLEKLINTKEFRLENKEEHLNSQSLDNESIRVHQEESFDDLNIGNGSEEELVKDVGVVNLLNISAEVDNFIKSFNESQVLDINDVEKWINRYKKILYDIEKNISTIDEETVNEAILKKYNDELDEYYYGLSGIYEMLDNLVKSGDSTSKKNFSKYLKLCNDLFIKHEMLGNELDEYLKMINQVSQKEVEAAQNTFNISDNSGINSEKAVDSKELDYYNSLLNEYDSKLALFYKKVSETVIDIKYQGIFESAISACNKLLINIEKINSVIETLEDYGIKSDMLSFVSKLINNCNMIIEMCNNALSQIDSQIKDIDDMVDMKEQVREKRIKASPQVKLRKTNDSMGVTRIQDGVAFVDELRYVDVMNEALEGLDEAYRRHSRIGFIDRALVAKNIKDRYKIVVKSVKETLGWENVDKLLMISTTFQVNDEPSINAKEYGSSGYDLYDTMDFADLLLNRAIRLRHLELDEEVFNLIVEDCGGDFFEVLFTKRPTLQAIQVGGTVMTKQNRSKSVQLAFEEKAKKAAKKGDLKDEFVEELFASGKVKKTPENIALARKMTKKASQNGRRNKSSKGLMAAQRIAQMTPVQAITGLFASGFLYMGGLLRKART